MKNILLKTLLLGLISTTSIIGQNNTSDYNSKNISAVFISNINGSVTVNGTNSSTLKVKTTQYKMKDGYTLHQFMFNDTLVVVMEDKNFSASECDSDYNFPGNIRQRNCNRNISPDHVNITIDLPKGITIKASTINEGSISVNNISETIVAKNINGSIKLDGVSAVKNAHTINGDLDITFRDQPYISGEYYSLNGDINIITREYLNAELTFKSFNGDFYTNINELKVNDSKIKPINNNGRFKIKVNQKTYMTAGEGCIELALETFNGDAILKTIEN